MSSYVKSKTRPLGAVKCAPLDASTVPKFPPLTTRDGTGSNMDYQVTGSAMAVPPTHRHHSPERTDRSGGRQSTDRLVMKSNRQHSRSPVKAPTSSKSDGNREADSGSLQSLRKELKQACVSMLFIGK